MFRPITVTLLVISTILITRPTANAEVAYGGIGFRFHIIAEQPVITWVYKDMPADKAGIRNGDVVVKVDGASTSGISREDFNVLVKGAVGTKVTFTVKREDESEPLEIAVIRKLITIPSDGEASLTDVTKQELEQLLREFLTASLRGDAITSDRIITESFMEIQPRGGMSTKFDHLSLINARKYRIANEEDDSVLPTFDLHNVDIRGYHNVAMIYVDIEWVYPNGKTYLRTTVTSVKDQSTWQIAAVHSTIIPVWKVRDLDDNELLELTPEESNQESSFKSLNSDKEAFVRFKNTSSAMVKVYWLDFQGKRTLYISLSPGDQRNQWTYLTHPWLVADSEDKALGIYIPTSEPAIVVTRGK